MGTEAKIQVVGMGTDLITEIMTRLPLKSLLRFLCVCKTWYDLISSPEIVVKHNKNVSLFFQRCSAWNEVSSTLLFRFSGLPMYLTVPLVEVCPKIIGCCNGVVCLSLSGVFALWNPATTQFRIIGKHCSVAMNLNNCGFCFDPIANSFKVVYVQLLEMGADKVKMNILTTATNCWRETNILLPYRIGTFYRNSGICVGRYIYWRVTVDDVYYVLCFDMVNEAFNRIEFPYISHPYSSYDSYLSCYNENIALISNGWHYDSVVYMLNDGRQSWTHVRTILKPPPSESFKHGFFIKDGVDWLVFNEHANFNQLWMIDLETKEMAKFPWKRECVYEFYQYKQSRVSF